MGILLICFTTVNCPVTKKKIFIYPILQSYFPSTSYITRYTINVLEGVGNIFENLSSPENALSHGENVGDF